LLIEELSQLEGSEEGARVGKGLCGIGSMQLKEESVRVRDLGLGIECTRA